MARALEQILQELDSVYNPQKDVYNQQIKALPGMEQAELGGLEQSKQDSFNQITQGANRRGVAFGGIPLGEQAQYLGSTYLPAVANLKGRFAGLKGDLSQRLAELGAKQRMDAYGIRDFELAEDARREAAAAAARASAGGGGGGGGFTFGGGGTAAAGAGQAQGGYGYSKKADGGFAFVDPYGNPISAATYAANSGISFRDLLQTMANQGDKGAAQALGFVGNLGEGTVYDPGKINSGNNANIFNSLVWGTPYSYSRGSAGGGGGGGGGGGY